MRGQHGETDDGRKSRGEHGAENAHTEREHKQPVQKDVGQTAGEHGRHSEFRRAVVAHEAEHDIVENKGRSKQQNDAQIRFRHGKYRIVRTERRGYRPGKRSAGKHEYGGKNGGGIKSIGEYAAGRALVARAAENGVGGRAAHAEHQPAAVNKIVYRHRQIERCQTVRSQSQRNKKRVGQYVAGQTQHAEHVKGYIPGEFFVQRFSFGHTSFSPYKKSAGAFRLLRT